MWTCTHFNIMPAIKALVCYCEQYRVSHKYLIKNLKVVFQSTIMETIKNIAYGSTQKTNNVEAEAYYQYVDQPIDRKEREVPVRETIKTKEMSKKICYVITALVIIVAALALVLAVVAVILTLVQKQDNTLTNEVQDLRDTLQEQQGEIELLQILTSVYSSCKDIPQNSPSGEYWIETDSIHSPVRVYCDMNQRNCSCNSTGGWARVANLDMTDPSQQCPNELTLETRTTAPLRTCGKSEAGCTSTTYPSHGIEYSRVCGRVIGYQLGTTDAFFLYSIGRSQTIDSLYVDGVSLTHGQSPRQHIWTFANALDETRSDNSACPCTRSDVPFTGAVPPFIGQDYFCATGSRETAEIIFYPDDPLWDGQGCGGNSTCCEFNNPPWFCKQLPQSTTDDIELRLCDNESTGNEDTQLEMIEIYIQ